MAQVVSEMALAIFVLLQAELERGVEGDDDDDDFNEGIDGMPKPAGDQPIGKDDKAKKAADKPKKDGEGATSRFKKMAGGLKDKMKKKDDDDDEEVQAMFEVCMHDDLTCFEMKDCCWNIIFMNQRLRGYCTPN